MGFANMVKTFAVHPFVLDEERRRREIGAEPNVAAKRIEVELGARLGRHQEGRVLHTTVPHLMVRNVMLVDGELGPAFDRYVTYRSAAVEGADQDAQNKAGHYQEEVLQRHANFSMPSARV